MGGPGFAGYLRRDGGHSFGVPDETGRACRPPGGTLASEMERVWSSSVLKHHKQREGMP